jgi:hypothetical protein
LPRQGNTHQKQKTPTKAHNQQSKKDRQDVHPKKMITAMKHVLPHKTQKRKST